MQIPLALSHEHAALQDTVRDLLRQRSDVWSAIGSPRGYDEGLWHRLAEMGLPGLPIPEELGGGGFGAIEMFLTFREMGRAVLASPFFGTVALAANALVHAGSAAAQQDLLPRIAAGELLASLAVCEQSGSWRLADVTLAADGQRLTGTKCYVIDGQAAALFLVVARTDEGLGLFAVDREAPGLRVHELTTLDLTRRQVHLALDGTPAERVSPPGDCTEGLQHALDLAVLALVAEQIGGAEEVLSTAVEYAKVREQFGVPIGSFQAIKHKLADMAFDVERMVSAGWAATAAVARSAPDPAADLRLAKVYCSEAYFRVAAENIQVHGGIGFTWEHPAHLYFRRAKSSELLLGTPDEHREELLAELVRREDDRS